MSGTHGFEMECLGGGWGISICLSSHTSFQLAARFCMPFLFIAGACALGGRSFHPAPDPQLNVGVSQKKVYLVGGPYNKDYSILGSILGSPYVGKAPW